MVMIHNDDINTCKMIILSFGFRILPHILTHKTKSIDNKINKEISKYTILVPACSAADNCQGKL